MSRERERFDEIGKKVKREIDASSVYDSFSQMGARPRVGPPVGPNLNRVTPCAACKLLRRRCADECPFSPYFSPHEPQKFAAVHKVFGASNVSKLLLEVPEIQRADTANSLVYEANVRLRDPVYGCMGAILALQQEVQSLQAELNAIRTEILRYKHREAANNIINIASNHATSLVSNSGGAIMSVAMLPPPSTPPLPPLLPLPPPPPSIVISSYNNSSSSSTSTSLYTATMMSTSGYSTIPNDSVTFFD